MSEDKTSCAQCSKEISDHVVMDDGTKLYVGTIPFMDDGKEVYFCSDRCVMEYRLNRLPNLPD